MNNNISIKENLDEISFIRPILILLLILVHCFTVFNGGWPPFEGYKDCSAYMWFSRTCYSFMLETFIFISGYVWAFQILELKKSLPFKTLLYKKAERLLLPSLVFSLIYYQLFEVGTFADIKSIIQLLSGVGHLWYLPVLFWCFVLMYLIELLYINDKIKFILLFLIALVPFPGLPLQLWRVPYYLFFFFVGFKTWQYGDNFRLNLNRKKLTIFWSTFVIVFVILRGGVADISEILSNASITTKLALKPLSTLLKICYSSVGLLSIYSTAVFFTKKYNLNKKIIEVGSLCFGVYIFQEFIIKYLYYYTELPLKVGYVALPWITFVITLILSLLLSKITKSL